jgi:ATP-dependent phosphofructokinase / diphosphate-dependent phosphofructokinase
LFSVAPIDTRVSVLGHIHRGGIPSALDRLVATSFGKAAIALVAQEQFGKMVDWQNERVVAVPLTEVILPQVFGIVVKFSPGQS